MLKIVALRDTIIPEIGKGRMSVLIEKAKAKINLYLKVTGRRPDGYHDLVTVMQSVSLADTLTFERNKGDDIVLNCGGALANDESNLVIRAARAYFAASKAPFGVSITLEKRIPMQAGLGGGSADAAATLRALNTLDGNRFSEEELCAIGATVGADVPFCVVNGTRLCRGIGEKMQPIDNRLGGTLVIAIAGEGVSTPVAFRALDGVYGDFGSVGEEAPAALLAAMERGELIGAKPHFYNMFEESVEPIRPAVTACKQTLLACGATHAMMSGTGPSVWGLFPNRQDALCAVEALEKEGARAYLCVAE